MIELNAYQRARFLLGAGIVLCFWLCWMFGRWFHIPVEPGYQASVFLQPSLYLSSFILVLAVFACALLGTVVAGVIRFNAGLLTAAAGLVALSIRGGSGRYTQITALTEVGSPAMFLRFAFESLFLATLLGATWWLLRGLHQEGKIKDRESQAPAQEKAGPPLEEENELPALAIQIAITVPLLLLLLLSEAKMQALVGIFLASAIGAAVSHIVFPSSSRGWYWLPPLLIGFAGYLLAYFGPPQGLELANVKGVFAALVRAMPLDYAGAGTAGALIGHWTGQDWQRESEQEDE